MVKDYLTRITLLPQSASKVFAYFTISPETIKEFDLKYGVGSFEKSKPIVKLSYLGLDKITHGNKIYMDAFCNNWYIDTESNGIDAYCTLSRVLEDGNEVEIKRSNTISIPRRDRSAYNKIEYINVMDFYKGSLSGVEK